MTSPWKWLECLSGEIALFDWAEQMINMQLLIHWMTPSCLSCVKMLNEFLCLFLWMPGSVSKQTAGSGSSVRTLPRRSETFHNICSLVTHWHQTTHFVSFLDSQFVNMGQRFIYKKIFHDGKVTHVYLSHLLVVVVSEIQFVSGQWRLCLPRVDIIRIYKTRKVYVLQQPNTMWMN